MDTYKEFAGIYDELINEDIDYVNWANTIIKICNELNVKMEDYLDLACGTGNMTELLAPCFKSVWGVDLSQDMLLKAEEKLRLKKLKAMYVCQDMIELDLNRKFDLITCCLDATNYLVNEMDLEKCFKSIYKHLKDNGVFIFDMNSFYKLKEIVGSNTFTYSDENMAYIWENSDEDDNIHMYVTFFVKEGSMYNRFDEEHIERAYKDELVEDLLKKSNLELRFKMDNYMGKHITETSERITFVVTKK